MSVRSTTIRVWPDSMRLAQRGLQLGRGEEVDLAARRRRRGARSSIGLLVSANSGGIALLVDGSTVGASRAPAHACGTISAEDELARRPSPRLARRPRRRRARRRCRRRAASASASRPLGAAVGRSVADAQLERRRRRRRTTTLHVAVGACARRVRGDGVGEQHARRRGGRSGTGRARRACRRRGRAPAPTSGPLRMRDVRLVGGRRRRSCDASVVAGGARRGRKVMRTSVSLVGARCRARATRRASRSAAGRGRGRGCRAAAAMPRPSSLTTTRQARRRRPTRAAPIGPSPSG